MRRFADFVVDRRVLILAIVVCLSIVCGVASPFVPVIADESAYLQEDSEIRTGLDIIAEEFPETAHENTIRVMFYGLTSVEKPEVERQLFRIPYVSSVTYGEGEEYNNGAYTLYILTTEYAYGSQQQADLESALKESFADHEMTIENDSQGSAALPWWLPFAALGVTMCVLFIFCSSWMEPLFILACSIMAVCIGNGTNLLLGRISQMASSLAPTLIFLLSAAWCMIVSYKWRKECRQTRDPYEAMKLTVMNAFPVLAASAFASAGAFLMLIFLGSGLAADVGIVMAKGTALAFVTVLFSAPTMFILGQEVLHRTAKKAPGFSGMGLSRTQFDYRKGFFAGFVCIFAVSCVLSFFTKPAFGITRHDTIAAEFPEENHITVVYQNGDENPAGRLANQFQEMEGVTSVSSYATTLGKQYTPEAMFTMLHQTGSSMAFSLPILQILYYDYFTDAQLPFITASDLIRFINTDVESAEGIGELLSAETRQLFARMAPFTDQEMLQTPMGIAQAGPILGLDQEQTIALYSSYLAVRGGVEAEVMSPVTFLDYVVSSIAPDPEFAEEMTPEEVERLKGLQEYANPETAAGGLTLSQAADLLDVSEETMRLIYTEYFASQSSYTPENMTMSAFADFLQNTVLETEYFARELPEDTPARVADVAALSNLQNINTQMNIASLADFLNLAEDEVEAVVGIYHQTDTGLMSVQQFLAYLASPAVFDSTSVSESLSSEQKVLIPRFNAAVQAAVNTQRLDESQISQVTALPMSIVQSVFDALSPDEEQPVTAMSIQDFLTAVTSDAYTTVIDEEDMAELENMQSIVNTAVQNGQFSAQQMAEIVGLDSAQTSMVYTMHSRQQAAGQTMSPSEFVHFVASSAQAASELGEADTSRLSRDAAIMDAAQTGGTLSPDDAAALFGLEAGQARLLYTYHDALSQNGASWVISMADLLEYLTSDAGTALDLVPEDDQGRLRLWARLSAAAADGTEYTAQEMADLLSLDVSFVEQVYIRYLVESGEVNTWAVPLYELINFIADTGDTGYAGEGLDWVRQLKPLIDAVVAGRQYSALGFYMLLQSLGQSVDESTVEFIYLYYAAVHGSSSLWTLSPLELVDFLASQVLEQPAYSAYLDEAMQEQILELQRQIETSRARLKGPNFSLMTINTTLPLDSTQMRELFERIRSDLDSTLVGTYYLTGNIPISYAMAQDFTGKWMLLTLLTDLCTFAALCCMMASLLVPLVATLLVQCSVWVITGLMGIFGDVYYLALLIGQCFLVGAVTTFVCISADDYREARRTMGREESARSFIVDGGAVTTLSTTIAMIVSFLALWLLAPDTAPGQISRLLSFSLLCGELLVLFFFPSILTLLDNWIKAKNAPPIPIQQKERPGGDWSGKRLLDEDTLVGLSKNTFTGSDKRTQKNEERPTSWASFVRHEPMKTASADDAEPSGGSAAEEESSEERIRMPGDEEDAPSAARQETPPENEDEDASSDTK